VLITLGVAILAAFISLISCGFNFKNRYTRLAKKSLDDDVTAAVQLQPIPSKFEQQHVRDLVTSTDTEATKLNLGYATNKKGTTL